VLGGGEVISINVFMVTIEIKDYEVSSFTFYVLNKSWLLDRIVYNNKMKHSYNVQIVYIGYKGS